MIVPRLEIEARWFTKSFEFLLTSKRKYWGWPPSNPSVHSTSRESLVLLTIEQLCRGSGFPAPMTWNMHGSCCRPAKLFAQHITWKIYWPQRKLFSSESCIINCQSTQRMLLKVAERDRLLKDAAASAGFLCDLHWATRYGRYKKTSIQSNNF